MKDRGRADRDEDRRSGIRGRAEVHAVEERMQEQAGDRRLAQRMGLAVLGGLVARVERGDVLRGIAEDERRQRAPARVGRGHAPGFGQDVSERDGDQDSGAERLNAPESGARHDPVHDGSGAPGDRGRDGQREDDAENAS